MTSFLLDGREEDDEERLQYTTDQVGSCWHRARSQARQLPDTRTLVALLLSENLSCTGPWNFNEQQACERRPQHKLIMVFHWWHS